MASPSRDFLVRQATLTVLADRYPLSISFDGRPAVAKRLEALIRDEFEEGKEFVASVKLEFGSLQRRVYQRAHQQSEAA